MKKGILSFLLLLSLQVFAVGEPVDDLKLYLSHKYISRVLEISKPQISMTPPRQTREEYVQEMMEKHVEFLNKLEPLLQPQNADAAIAYVTKELSDRSNNLENSSDREPSEFIKVTETKALLANGQLRLKVRNNNIYIASRYIHNFLDSKHNVTNETQLLFYSDVLNNSGWMQSVIHMQNISITN